MKSRNILLYSIASILALWSFVSAVNVDSQIEDELNKKEQEEMIQKNPGFNWENHIYTGEFLSRYGKSDGRFFGNLQEITSKNRLWLSYIQERWYVSRRWYRLWD